MKTLFCILKSPMKSKSLYMFEIYGIKHDFYICKLFKMSQSKMKKKIDAFFFYYLRQFLLFEAFLLQAFSEYFYSMTLCQNKYKFKKNILLRKS